MPDLAQLTDYTAPVMGAPVGIGATADTVPTEQHSVLGRIINRLTGTNGEERYQTWPEKTVRNAIAAPHDIALPNPYSEGTEEYLWNERQRQNAMVPSALDMTALAGTGGLAGTGEGVGTALGSTPFLRPALKYEGKIYKAPPNGQHLDALPSHLADTFQKQAMSGEDISNFNFGFMNHKGQFLNREDALDYAVKQGLVDPHAGQYGALTSTLLSDGTPGIAIESQNNK